MAQLSPKEGCPSQKTVPFGACHLGVLVQPGAADTARNRALVRLLRTPLETAWGLSYIYIYTLEVKVKDHFQYG